MDWDDTKVYNGKLVGCDLKYLRDEYKVHCDWKDDYLLPFTADTKISLTDDEKNWL
jgi:hypothetical protein